LFFFHLFFGIDFYYKTNPLIYTCTILPDKHDDPILLTPENLVFAWGIMNRDALKTETNKVIYPVQKEIYYKKNEKKNEKKKMF